MPQCKLYEICCLDAKPGEELCILHSRRPGKNHIEFDKALAEYRKNPQGKFRNFVFPGPANFSEQIFDAEADFYGATFSRAANFSKATFNSGANFIGAKFHNTVEANFTYAKFNGGAHFSNVIFASGARFTGVEFAGHVNFSDSRFPKQADFSSASFDGPVDFCDATFCEAKFESTRFAREADFFRATFTARANFLRARFAEGADFSDACFMTGADFSHSKFLDISLFVPWTENGEESSTIFSGVPVDFREVIIRPLDALIFRDADLRECQFLGTDLRKAEFTNVTWPEIICKKWPMSIRTRWPQLVGRFAIYDEIEVEQKGEAEKRSHIEQLYRQLKQNYEDRRDYERARHFHIGEKEMRRKNSQGWLKILLTAYRWVSGYGESCLLPLFWLVILLAGSALGYLSLGLWSNASKSVLEWSEWLSALGYSFRVMTLLRPDDLIPIGYAKAVRTFETLAGPILIGLFALALRQRLKR